MHKINRHWSPPPPLLRYDPWPLSN